MQVIKTFFKSLLLDSIKKINKPNISLLKELTLSPTYYNFKNKNQIKNYLKKIKIRKINFKKLKKNINFFVKKKTNKLEYLKFLTFEHSFYIFYKYWVYFFLGLGYVYSINFLFNFYFKLSFNNFFNFFFFYSQRRVKLKKYNFYIYYTNEFEDTKNNLLTKTKRLRKSRKRIKWKVVNRNYRYKWRKKEKKRFKKLRKIKLKKLIKKNLSITYLLNINNSYKKSKNLINVLKYKLKKKLKIKTRKGSYLKNKISKKFLKKLNLQTRVKKLKTPAVLFNTLVNYYCSTFFKRNCIIIPFNYYWTKAYAEGHSRGMRYFKKNRFLKSVFFTQRLLASLIVSLKYKDSCLFVPLLQQMFEFVHFKNHRRLFYFCRRLIFLSSVKFFSTAFVLGISLCFFGKLGVGGNSRKRAYKYKYGLVSNSTKLLKIDYSNLFFRTETGVVGFTYSVYY